MSDVFGLAWKGDLDTVRSLIEVNPDLVFNKDNQHGRTPLHWAALNGQVALVNFLLANKADINGQDNHGQTPLHCAVSQSQKDVAKLLLCAKADKTVKDGAGKTPSDLASSSRRNDIVELLASDGRQAEVREDQLGTRGEAGELLRQHGEKVAPKSSDEVGAIVAELVALDHAAYAWFVAHRPGAFEKYPQYSRIREIGILIHAKVGIKGMEAAAHHVRRMDVAPPGEWGWDFVVHSWAGIGKWQP